MSAPTPVATEAHERHMATLKTMTTTQQRREYIDGVKRAEGAFYGKWLEEDFAVWWAFEKDGKTKGVQR